jgi:uncharacterized protein (DUF952 family)
MDRLVHLCSRQAWESAQEAGIYRPPSLEQVGFIHCSRPEQILEVANRFYAGQNDLLLLWIDPLRLQAEIRWEPADGQVFPHIYGPLNLGAITHVQVFAPGVDGIFRLLF